MNTSDLVRSRSASVRQRVYNARPLPLCNVDYVRTLDVSSFGALPGSGENALPAIQRTLDEAVAGGVPTRVCLAPGRYDLYPSFTGAGHCLAVKGANGLVLEGNHALLVIHNPLAGWLRLEDCRRLLIQGLEVDYDPLPFTQGIVRDVHASDGTFDLELDQGYSRFDEPHWALLEPNMNWMDCASWGMLKDRVTPGRLKPGCPNAVFARSFQRVGDRIWRITVSQSDVLAHFDVGDRYVHQSRPESWLGTFAWIQNCESISFIDMLTHASPSWSYFGIHSSHLSFINCEVRLKEGRWHTLDSDGINTHGGRVGPWIENCLFEAGADDTFVSGQAWLPLQRMVDTRTLQLGMTNQLVLRSGDELLFYNPRAGLPLGKAVVDAVDYISGTVTCASAIPRLEIGSTPALSDRVYNLACLNNNLVVHGNTVRNNRRWPVWIYTPAMDGAIVEHNAFIGCDSAAVKISNDVSWDVPHSIVAHYAALPDELLPGNTNTRYDIGHLLIANNTIDTCGFNSHEAAIQIGHPRLGNRPSPWPMVQDLVIAGNEIANWCGQYALSLGNTQQTVVAGNIITNQQNPLRMTPTSYLYTTHSNDLTVQGNKLSDDLPLRIATQGQGTGQLDIQPDSNGDNV